MTVLNFDKMIQLAILCTLLASQGKAQTQEPIQPAIEPTVQSAHGTAQTKAKPAIDKTEWALLAADASVRSLDAYSTRRGFARGDRETVLPNFIVDNDAAMASFSAGVVSIEYLVARKLNRHHRNIAHLITLIDVSITAPSAVHNLYVVSPQPVNNTATR